MSEYRVELVYADGHRSPYGHAEQETAQLVEWCARLGQCHRDVKSGKAQCRIRKVGSDA